MKATNDVNGKPSSKRIAGFIIAGVGLVMMSMIGFCSFFMVLKDATTAFNAAMALLGFGCGLLGWSVGEYIADAIKSGKPELPKPSFSGETSYNEALVEDYRRNSPK